MNRSTAAYELGTHHAKGKQPGIRCHTTSHFEMNSGTLLGRRCREALDLQTREIHTTPI